MRHGKDFAKSVFEETDRDCDTLMDINFENKKFIYQFKNIRLITAESPSQIFKRCGYDRSTPKDAPILLQVKDKIVGAIRRF